jgi:Tol biopolymer transport system component
MTQAATAGTVRIVQPFHGDYFGLTFSRDGNFLYVVRSETPSGFSLYRMPSLGGPGRKLLGADAAGVFISSVSLSPDGRQFAFIRADNSEGKDVLVVANEDGTHEKELLTRKFPEQYSNRGASWSPDGRLIACANEDYTAEHYVRLVGVDVSSGKERALSTHPWNSANNTVYPVWLSDGSGLIVAAAEHAGTMPQLWHVAFPGGEVHRLTHDWSGYSNISLTADSSTLAALRSDRVINLWVAPEGDASRARQITSGQGRDDGLGGLSWTVDGRIVYRSDRWWLSKYLVNGGGWHRTATTFGQFSREHHRSFCFSRRSLYCGVSHRSNIWRMNVDGGDPKQLTRGGNGMRPQVTPDGKSVVYGVFGYGPGSQTNWKVPIDGGTPEQMNFAVRGLTAVSPDGNLIAGFWQDPADSKLKLAIFPVEGGPPIKMFGERPGVTSELSWTPDGRALDFIRSSQGVSNLWRQPVDGGPPEQLTDFKDQYIFGLYDARRQTACPVARHHKHGRRVDHQLQAEVETGGRHSCFVRVLLVGLKDVSLDANASDSQE